MTFTFFEYLHKIADQGYQHRRWTDHYNIVLFIFYYFPNNRFDLSKYYSVLYYSYLLLLFRFRTRIWVWTGTGTRARARAWTWSRAWINIRNRTRELVKKWPICKCNKKSGWFKAFATAKKKQTHLRQAQTKALNRNFSLIAPVIDLTWFSASFRMWCSILPRCAAKMQRGRNFISS